MTYDTYLEIRGLRKVNTALDTLSIFCKIYRAVPASCGGCPFLTYCEMVSDGEIIPLDKIITDILRPALAELIDMKYQEIKT